MERGKPAILVYLISTSAIIPMSVMKFSIQGVAGAINLSNWDEFVEN